jgi:hypothetical protein
MEIELAVVDGHGLGVLRCHGPIMLAPAAVA